MALSDVFSFVSSLAVIFTLVFLLLQMRQTNRNQQGLMQQGRTTRIVQLLLAQAGPDIGSLFARAKVPDMTLNLAEVHRLNCYGGALLWSSEDSFLQHQAGLLDDASWATELATLRGHFMLPFIRVSWQLIRHHATGEYVTFVDGLLREIRPAKGMDELAMWREAMEKEIEQAG